MKTEVILIRNTLNLPIEQSTKTGMFNATKLLRNAISNNIKISTATISEYRRNKSSIELFDQIMLNEGLEEKEVINNRSGRYGGTWLHPIQFIDFMMWLSPTFRYQALKMVHDKLIEFRNDSGDSFKMMNAALTKAYPDNFGTERWQNYTYVANRIAVACGAPPIKNRWNLAPTWCLALRNEIQNNITLLAEHISTPSVCIEESIRKAYDKIGTPATYLLRPNKRDNTNE